MGFTFVGPKKFRPIKAHNIATNKKFNTFIFNNKNKRTQKEWMVSPPKFNTAISAFRHSNDNRINNQFA